MQYICKVPRSAITMNEFHCIGLRYCNEDAVSGLNQLSATRNTLYYTGVKVFLFTLDTNKCSRERERERQTEREREREREREKERETDALFLTLRGNCRFQGFR